MIDSALVPSIPPTKKPSQGKCPFPHHLLSFRKTTPAHETATPDTPIQQDADGVWHIYGYREARALLKQEETRQAGFLAEQVTERVQFMNPPVLYADGPAHHEQRRRAARFFTPKATQEYHQMMEAFADEVLAPLRAGKTVDLSELTLKMAVKVAGQVIGLTSSRLPGLERRLSIFFEQGEKPSRVRQGIQNIMNQAGLAMFFFFDVQPAIRARRKAPQEDVISHLIESGYSDAEILTECIMYGAAGMATTREFISAAAWHLLEQPERVKWFLQADEAERYAFLHETLRLEPVVGHLLRRTTAELTIPSGDTDVTIPAGSLVDLHIYAANADETIVGEAPLHLCPMREMSEPRVPAEMMSFGHGHHRCPGAYLAIQETEIFLRRLLVSPGLRVEKWPTKEWSPIAKGYELRDFMLTTQPA